jgi:hypothetical protein
MVLQPVAGARAHPAALLRVLICSKIFENISGDEGWEGRGGEPGSQLPVNPNFSNFRCGSGQGFGLLGMETVFW